MRSLFYLACAVLVCAAGFLYLAADFATHHPDSQAVSCARTVHSYWVQYNPVTALTTAGFHAVRAAGQLLVQTATGAREAAPTGCCERPTPCPAPAATPMQPEEEPTEVIDLSLLPIPWEQLEGAQEEAEVPPCDPPSTPTADEPGAVTVPAGAIEENDDTPEAMPPADDEEIPAPTETTPPAKDEQTPASPTMEDLVREQLDATRQHVFEMWFDLFQKSEGAVTDEEPPADDSGETANDESEKNSKTANDGSKSCEEGDKVNEADEPEEGETEDPEGGAVDCMEDPNTHQPHSGCPYMGGNSPMPHCQPAVTDPTPARPHKKKVKSSPIVDPLPDAEETDAPPEDGTKSFPMEPPASSGRPRNLGPTPNDETPSHPEVDTMEFRKSDAKEGEFDSRPF